MSTTTTTDRVPCAPLAEAFLESGLSGGEVGRRMGWPTKRGNTQVRRALGLLPNRNGAGKWRRREQMPYELAIQFCEVLGVDPVEIGL